MIDIIDNDKPLIILTGPTAVGKSSLALALAQKFEGEIVAADSRTVYRGMDIATAKATPTDLARVPHHLINIVRPDQDFSLPDFLERATASIEDIQARQRRPFLVGGTMLYITALVEGWQVPRVAPRPGLREELEADTARRGPQALYAELKALDPAAAERINPSNVRRIVRAWEVYHTTGQLFSEAQGKQGTPYRLLKLGLTLEREALYGRADARIESMFEAGLVEEVQTLLAAGYSTTSPAMSSVGYSQVIAYLKGQLSLAQAKEQMRFATHRYIRHQYAWFRRASAIQWLDAAAPTVETQAANLISSFLGLPA